MKKLHAKTETTTQTPVQVTIKKTLIIGEERSGKTLIAAAILEADRQLGIRTTLIDEPVSMEEINAAVDKLKERRLFRIEDGEVRHLVLTYNVGSRINALVDRQFFDRVIMIAGKAI